MKIQKNLVIVMVALGCINLAQGQVAAQKSSFTSGDLAPWFLSPQDIPTPAKVKMVPTVSSMLRLSEGFPGENLDNWSKGKSIDIMAAQRCEGYFPISYKAIESKIKNEEFNDTDNLKSEMFAIVRNPKTKKVFKNCIERLWDRSKYYLIFYKGENNQLPFLTKTLRHLEVEIDASIQPQTSSQQAESSARTSRIKTLLGFWKNSAPAVRTSELAPETRNI
jgi:hypothetical protein